MVDSSGDIDKHQHQEQSGGVKPVAVLAAETVLGEVVNDDAGAGKSGAGGPGGEEEIVMPVSDVMALLQAMREEQLDSLKNIADGVQQLQSQVMVLGESAVVTEEKTGLCLERLAGLERRVGSIPVPFQPPNRAALQQQQLQQQQQQQQQQRFQQQPYTRGGRETIARAPAFAAESSSKTLARAPAPAAVAASGSVPAWLDRRMEEEPAKPHFMRNDLSQPSGAAAPAAVASAAAPAAPAVAASAAVDPAEAAKEAKRRAFEADRAKIQARIAARQGGSSAAAPPAVAATATMPAAVSSLPSSHGTRQGDPGGAAADTLVQAAAKPPSSFVGAGPGAGVGTFAALSPAEEALRVQRVKEEQERKRREKQAQAEREEQRRKAEEERLRQEREEARRRREEEEARKIREAEEARIRQEEKRRAEAKRQAKTKHLMSSLFDKTTADDGKSLFGALGAALPAGSSVFDDASSGPTNGLGGESGARPTFSSTEQQPQPAASSKNSIGVGGGSLFAGLDDVPSGGHLSRLDDDQASRRDPETATQPGTFTESTSTSLFSGVDSEKEKRGSLFSGIDDDGLVSDRGDMFGDEPDVKPKTASKAPALGGRRGTDNREELFAGIDVDAGVRRAAENAGGTSKMPAAAAEMRGGGGDGYSSGSLFAGIGDAPAAQGSGSIFGDMTDDQPAASSSAAAAIERGKKGLFAGIDDADGIGRAGMFGSDGDVARGAGAGTAAGGGGSSEGRLSAGVESGVGGGGMFGGGGGVGASPKRMSASIFGDDQAGSGGGLFDREVDISVSSSIRRKEMPEPEAGQGVLFPDDEFPAVLGGNTIDTDKDRAKAMDDDTEAFLESLAPATISTAGRDPETFPGMVPGPSGPLFGSGEDDDIFSSAAGPGSALASAAAGGGGGSIFDRGDTGGGFSIESEEESADDNIFGGGGGGGGVAREADVLREANAVVGGDGRRVDNGNASPSASFLSALGDADLSLSGQDGGKGYSSAGNNGEGREGMFDVRL